MVKITTQYKWIAGNVVEVSHFVRTTEPQKSGRGRSIPDYSGIPEDNREYVLERTREGSRMAECVLCQLPLSDSRISRNGKLYCCQGCLNVDTTLESIDPPERHTQAGEFDSDADDKGATSFFRVNGMHCTTCETFLSMLADRITGIYFVEANYGLGGARVRYDQSIHDEASVAEHLSQSGYEFERFDEETGPNVPSRKHDTIQRVIVGGFLAMLIMPWYFFSLYPIYIGFDQGILDLGRTTTFGIYFPLVFIGILTTIILLYTGYPVLRGAWISIATAEPNMDLLVSIAAVSAYGYSVIALAQGSTHLYFDVTVMVILVVTIGRYYKDSIRESAVGRLEALTKARVTEAVRLGDDGRETIDLDRIQPGDELLVEPGERIPLDGIIVSGSPDIDESLLTGESFPIAKSPDDPVIGGSIVLNEAVVIRVDDEVQSMADRIAQTMWQIQTERGGIQRFADKLATIFVPLVIALGSIATVYQLANGSTVAGAMLTGLTILIVSCPCAMGLATPLAVSAGLRDALRSGIVITNQTVFEAAPNADCLVFDKTGTLTAGEMSVADVYGHHKTLEKSAAVERYDSHPVAEAIVSADTDNGQYVVDGGTRIEAPHSGKPGSTDLHQNVDDFRRYPGEGIGARIDGELVCVGTKGLIEREIGPIDSDVASAIDGCVQDGSLPVVVGWGENRGLIEIVDKERTLWSSLLEQFNDENIVILSGDETADKTQFADHTAVDEVLAGVPPDGKAEAVRRMKSKGTTVMVGDGTNDAPALAQADLGIALGESNSIATEGADVVVLNSDLGKVSPIFAIARGTKRRIRENLAWALLYNAIALPLALVGMINPFFAAIAMALSSIIVVTNSRRKIAS